MLYKLFNAIIKPFKHTGLNQVIYFVTSKCNLRCQNCFNWTNLNKSKDLTYSEIKKTAEGLPSFKVLLISGGEPFLRKDLPDVISLFQSINKIGFVGIPTNGTQTEAVMSLAEKILKISKNLSVNLYFSIDGLRQFHDESRGVKGSFEKNITTIEKVRELKKTYPNLSVNINTVISARNLKEIPNLISFIKNKGRGFVDGHYFEIIRGYPKDPGVKNIDVSELKELYQKIILPYQLEVYSHRGSGLLNLLLSRLAAVNLYFLYKTQYDNFIQKKAWPMKCQAGKSILVVTSDGKLAACELRPSLTNVKKINYNVKKWLSDGITIEKQKIEDSKCYCTHACFITESMYQSKKVIFCFLPKLLLKSLRQFTF